MAENHRDSICTDVIDGLRKMQVSDDMQKKISRLKDVKYYGNPFLWEVRESCLGADEPIEFKTLDELVKSLTKQSKRVTFKNGSELFNIYSFYNKLVVCYERFITGQLDESMTEVEGFARSVELMTYDELDEQYINAYKHILYSSYAYIATSMNPYKFDEIMKDIKLISELSNQEKSAIHAVKALVFLKYPSKSKLISFQEADKARLLQDNNVEYLNIWLKTKGRLNREYNNFAKPDDKEVQIVEDLYKISKTFWHFYQVADVFVKVSKHRERNEHSRKTYFSLTSEAMLKAIDLAANDEILVTECLRLSIDQPKLLLSESIIHKKIEELHNAKNVKVYSLLGMYYFNHEKDYEKAKEFFNLSIEVDSFYNIIKIECMFKNPDNFPFIEMLMDQFQNFSNELKRVKILLQILIYCVYYIKD